jgi:hypothetical protein
MRLSAPSRPLLRTTDSIVVPPDRFAVTSSHVGDGTRPLRDLAAVHGEEPRRRRRWCFAAGRRRARVRDAPPGCGPGHLEGIRQVGLGVPARPPFRVFFPSGPRDGSGQVIDVATSVGRGPSHRSRCAGPTRLAEPRSFRRHASSPLRTAEAAGRSAGAQSTRTGASMPIGRGVGVLVVVIRCCRSGHSSTSGAGVPTWPWRTPCPRSSDPTARPFGQPGADAEPAEVFA